jgi:hypothetical protein
MDIYSLTSKSACTIYDEMKSPRLRRLRLARGLGFGQPAWSPAVKNRNDTYISKTYFLIL